MEEKSRKQAKLPHDNIVQESESRTPTTNEERSKSGPSRYGGRKQNIYTRGDEDVPQTLSRGEKRRMVDGEPLSADSVKPKRVKTTQSHTIILDNNVLRDFTVVVKADTIDNLTSDRKVLPIVCTKEEAQPRGGKRKLESDQHVVKGNKRLDLTPNYGHKSEYDRNGSHTEISSISNINKHTDVTAGQTKEDNQCNVECPNACVCKIGPSPLPRPTVRRGYPQVTPLYKKLLQRRLLNTVNEVFNKCCARQCSQVWCRGRFSRAHLEADYDPSDLRVDIYKWGQWKQKAGEQKTDADDDWFW